MTRSITLFRGRMSICIEHLLRDHRPTAVIRFYDESGRRIWSHMMEKDDFVKIHEVYKFWKYCMKDWKETFR